MGFSSFYKSGLAALAVLGLSSCIATPKLGDATMAVYEKMASTISATTGISAFEQTYYAFARRNCASCHGASQGPTFATGNLSSSYSEASNPAYVSFTTPSASKLAIFSGNGHCGSASCQAKEAEAVEMIRLWASVELAAAGGSGNPPGGVTPPPGSTGGVNPNAFVTQSLALPATLPTGTTYVPMRWQLSQLAPASALMTGAIFELEVQKLSATTYRVRNPKIAGLRNIVRVSGIHVFVKPSSDAGVGVEDIGAGSVWENDVVNVPITTLPATLPATPLSTTTFVPLSSFAMVIGIRSNQDSFTVSFDRLESSVAVMPTFASINTNILVPKCVGCHQTGNALGGVSYSTYAATLATVSAGNPGASRLYGSTSGANPSMPTGSLKLTTAEQNAISTWITNGAQNN